MKLKSPSKINLVLWVKEKRNDGFHEIETIFYENKDLYDEIEISFTEREVLSLNVCFKQKELNKLIPMDTNLAYKAAAAFFNETKIQGECDVVINKKIPFQAGLGGGSSNAASVLLGLNEITNQGLTKEKLLKIAESLGSDVPFFIVGGTCLGKGKGEVLTPLENKLNLQIKVIKPKDISVSTEWAYKQMQNREVIVDRSSHIKSVINAMKSGDYSMFFDNLFNDFEEIICPRHTELIEIKNQLLKGGCLSSGLCGSGSALFGLKKA